MRVVVAGASGLLGSALARALESRGDTVRRLVRGSVRDPLAEAAYDPSRGMLEEGALDGATALIDLAGANIAEGRWTEDRRRVLRSSRIDTARMLATAVQSAGRPMSFLQASAIGYYGPRPDSEVDENAPPGHGFLAELTRDWEDASAALDQQTGVRRVLLRFGVVLARSGGALPKMLLPFRWFVGGRIGDGRHWLSWISLTDAVRAILFLLDRDHVRGPCNLSAPQPVTNREFTAQAARLLGRPRLFPVPTFVLRALLGKTFCDETILSSARVAPRALLRAGFSFEHPELAEALRAEWTR